MSAPLSVFQISGRAMSAQLVRLNTVASNLANAGTVATTKEGAYRALKPVFTQVSDTPGVSTVKVDQVVQSNTEPTKRYDPNNPLADKDGNVWDAGVDGAAELVDMIETQRQYQNNVQVMQTAKTLTLDTLRLGQ
ncbi:flagellar basal body rod protein FlgC [Sphingomonas morindae]|uniref:Flagellar basal-body rod protein FlgC n=1 Tax=Sphingomonas morindae TaxID=1541170 RepID=A0ABY4XAN8_9SPHN|nr:flagellar basal body rod protein FlgC [Sphingomonas morindae]USI73736.1 flagellar basal body rod protein FlgC [Sphingomonas morindae]